MATELDELKTELERISREVAALRQKLNRALDKEGKGGTLADLRGVWNDVDFTEEEIEAAKIRVKDIG